MFQLKGDDGIRHKYGLVAADWPTLRDSVHSQYGLNEKQLVFLIYTMVNPVWFAIYISDKHNFFNYNLIWTYHQSIGSTILTIWHGCRQLSRERRLIARRRLDAFFAPAT